MRRWDKSYTRAIITVVVFIVMFAVFFWLDNKSFSFEGSEELASRLESWSPQTAEEGEPNEINGEILFYSIDCFNNYILVKQYVGPDQANRKFLKSSVDSVNDIGVIAVLYYNAVSAERYVNGAAAYRVDCTVYILDKDLKVLAKDTVKGGSPPQTTSGGDRYGEAPSLAKCRELAEKLTADLR